jgi:hypothetical protein
LLKAQQYSQGLQPDFTPPDIFLLGKPQTSQLALSHHKPTFKTFHRLPSSIMSDPLSVAGTAVGITSLGIQVCQGLIKYLRAVRGRKEEIREGIQEIEQVVSLLSSLNNTLPSVGPKSGTITLRTSLKNCYAKLEGLQELLVDLDDSQQSSKSMKRAANAIRAVSYPFQQERLNTIRQSLRSVLSDLDLIVSVISL